MYGVAELQRLFVRAASHQLSWFHAHLIMMNPLKSLIVTHCVFVLFLFLCIIQNIKEITNFQFHTTQTNNARVEVHLEQIKYLEYTVPVQIGSFN